MKLRTPEPENSIKLNGSTSRPHLLGTETTENKGFLREAGIPLGTGALPLGPSLDSITWKGEVVEPCGALRKLQLQSRLHLPSGRTLRVAFALIPHDFLHYIIDKRTCN
jgi:hypothetical protein